MKMTGKQVNTRRRDYFTFHSRVTEIEIILNTTSQRKKMSFFRENVLDQLKMMEIKEISSTESERRVFLFLRGKVLSV